MPPAGVLTKLWASIIYFLLATSTKTCIPRLIYVRFMDDKAIRANKRLKMFFSYIYKVICERWCFYSLMFADVPDVPNKSVSYQTPEYKHSEDTRFNFTYLQGTPWEESPYSDSRDCSRPPAGNTAFTRSYPYTQRKTRWHGQHKAIVHAPTITWTQGEILKVLAKKESTSKNLLRPRWAHIRALRVLITGNKGRCCMWPMMCLVSCFPVYNGFVVVFADLLSSLRNRWALCSLKWFVTVFGMMWRVFMVSHAEEGDTTYSAVEHGYAETTA